MGDSKGIFQTLPDNHVFVTPERGVKLMTDLAKWEKSEAYMLLTGFILNMNESVKGKSLSAKCHTSEIVKNVVSLMNKLDQIIDTNPPIDQPQRFGNSAFRNWFAQVKSKTLELLQEALPEHFHRAIPEIKVYLEESFGNSTRIDYGTGHESSFIMFLCCLYKIGALTDEDKVATICLIFNRYMQLVRRLQQTYRMEPAGSHGVWSLDDFQFAPFIWGSSQLIAHPIIEPQKFLDDDILNKFSKDFMFLACIVYIKEVKTGLFAEHSNQLWGISAVSSWTKINQGLIKMYKKEVLGKFPVVQHMLFGSLLPFRPVITH